LKLMVRQPADRQAAPSPLNVVQDFINTLDREAGIELLPDPAALGGWLAERGLVAAGYAVSGDDLRFGRGLREALRGVARGEDDAADLFNELASSVPLLLVAAPAGMRFEAAAAGIDRAWGELLVIVAQAAGDGSWSRLKACRSPSCRWVFYDRSRNRTGQWCSMQLCGSRSKMSRYRERLRAQKAKL
jgi:predicted RNA-binding Zn ribbon-like protein